METGARLCVALAMVVLFTVSAVRFVNARRGGANERGWRGGASFGLGALSLGVVLHGGVSSLAGRATLAAWVASLLSVVEAWRNKDQAVGWAGLIPVAVVAGGGVVPPPCNPGTAAPVVLLCVLAVAGLALWSSGQALDVSLKARAENARAAAIVFAGLTLSVVLVAGINWWIWGTPGGVISAVLALWAAWLMSATGLLWRRFARLSSVLDGLVALVATGVALGTQWTWPFG